MKKPITYISNSGYSIAEHSKDKFVVTRFDKEVTETKTFEEACKICHDGDQEALAKKFKKKPYPDWVCEDCAKKAGGRLPKVNATTWHNDICGVCEEEKVVTEPRDYRYPYFKGHEGIKI